MDAFARKTPKDVSEFEREQLRFFLSESNIAAVLSDLNPSLAWLPVIADIDRHVATQLGPWIERNFDNADAVQDVAANINFFGPEFAQVLESRLNQTTGLSPIVLQSWRLIISHMRNRRRGVFQTDWFEVAQRLRQGDLSTELLKRLADALRPKVHVGKRFPASAAKNDEEPQRPTDLMSVDFEIEDGVTHDEVLAAWPVDAPPESDERLLTQLTNELGAALEEASEAGVENSAGYSLPDSEVPSVAEHDQNASRTGFLVIVRVIAELWTRLARKDAQRALVFPNMWRKSQFRLVRRLALFAAADAAIPPDTAADLLIDLPAGELFLGNSSVEVYRLLDARWRDFAEAQQLVIEKRIIDGPPAELFWRDQNVVIDRCRFDMLGYLEGGGISLSISAQAMLDSIRKRRPDWQFRPREQAGFHTWTETGWVAGGDCEKLARVDDKQLVAAAKELAADTGPREGDPWAALCREYPERALKGLMSQARSRQWPTWAWHTFLWNVPKLLDSDDNVTVARLLLEWPKESFSDISVDVSWWLQEAAESLERGVVWPLWDRVADASTEHVREGQAEISLTTAINCPAGRLARILLREVNKVVSEAEFPEPLRQRLDALIGSQGDFGRLARICFSAEVATLFDRVPEWTAHSVIPLFQWSSPEAKAAWSARRYAGYIGSPELFRRTKQAFLELFQRADVYEAEIQVFASWLVVISIANRAHNADYPLVPHEVRTALRQAGTKALTSVGHSLAVEMKAAEPDEKIAKWRDVVGPVFHDIWPLDIELQTSATTAKLVLLLCASGAAFSEAAEIVSPFMRPDDPRHHLGVYSLSRADDVLYTSAPDKVLDLLTAVVAETAGNTVYGLSEALERIRTHRPELANTRKFQKLLRLASK